MVATITVKILVSCPGDVSSEKQEIIRLCDAFSKSNFDNTNINFHVLDWKDYIGSFGERPQEQLNNFFGEYDTYIGILWKRFGSKPGSINSSGRENESGTEEEFYTAIEKRIKHGKPDIKFFFKTYKRETNSLDENEQLSKVFKFHEEQKNSGVNYINEFDSPEDFNSKIVYLLNLLQNKVTHNIRVEKKRNVLDGEIREGIATFSQVKLTISKDYIPRSISQFSSLKNKNYTPYLKVERQSLSQLILLKKRIVLLGDAGSGKSTELQKLYNQLNQADSGLIPIFQSFRTYTPDHGIEAFLPEFWNKIPHDLILIIWDGLDEIQPEHFNTVVRQIKNFSEKYKDIRILLSCRTNFYELPVSNSSGTLIGFEPYMLNDFDSKDTIEYFQRKYVNSNSEAFLKEVSNKNLEDLITKPFFLMLIAENYVRENKLGMNRAELYEIFIMNKIDFDKEHFKSTFDIRGKKNEIVKLLQRVSLSMEILSKNQIMEKEILEIVSGEEFKTLKYCTAFKKKDGEDDIWQFEHNNIQEYLAAKALSSLEFDMLIRFIAYKPYHTKLIPSWVNTIAFLFSILKPEDTLFNRLLSWMLKNEEELIVKFEPDKIPNDLREQIFKGIFNHYKNHDVWISSNKFSIKELVRFGKSEANLQFLIDELSDETNSRTVQINAIRLIGLFDIKEGLKRHEIEKQLINLITDNINDPDYIHTVIYALKWAGMTDKETIEKLMFLVGHSKNQYIRSALYAILHKSKALNENVDYLIEGYKVIDKTIEGERGKVTLIDEGMNLLECVKKINSPFAISKLIKYISNSYDFYHGYQTADVLEEIFNNAVYAYKEDNSVYDIVLSWFLKDVNNFRIDNTKVGIKFFERIGRREETFYYLWENRDDNNQNNSLAIAKLLTPKLMKYVFDKYREHNLTNEDLKLIYSDMRSVRNEDITIFEKLILEETNIKVEKQIDYGVLQKMKLEADFNLLFDSVKFKNGILKVFEGQNKKALSYDELWDLTKENNRFTELDDIYSSLVLDLLRDFVTPEQSISKERILKWYEGAGVDVWYRVSKIYEHLTSHKKILITEEQEQWIVAWCKENTPLVKFKEALQANDNGGFSINTRALYVWYFTRRFNIIHSEEVMLDMLSFDYHDNNEWVGIDYLISNLKKNDICRRMLENIKDGICDFWVLRNHIRFLSQNNVEESYPFILEEIVNTKRDESQRKEFLDLFFEFTKNTACLKDILEEVDTSIKWAIIDKLVTNGEEVFVEEYLINEIDNESELAARSKAAEILVTLQNLQGLKIYVEWIKSIANKDTSIRRSKCILKLKIKDAIPYLIELLEISYREEGKVDKYDRFNSHVIDALYNVALESEENFVEVKSSLVKFMEEKSTINSNIKYLLHTIERFEQQFYMNLSQSFTINEVKEKLKLIE